MSADNTILIGSFPVPPFPSRMRIYYVSHVQAMENCQDSDDFPQELVDSSRVMFFCDAPHFFTKAEAMTRAIQMHEEIGYVEYGIQSLDFDRPLPSMNNYEAKCVEDLYFDRQKILRRISTEYEVEEIINNLASGIKQVLKKNYEDKVIFVGILKGAVPFMFDLMKHFQDISYQYGFIDIRSWGKETSVGSTHLPRVFYDNIPGIQDRTVILVDDIADTGSTLKLAKKRLKELGATKIIIVSLLSKPRCSTSVTRVNFHCGHIVEDDNFIVGNGMGLGEEYRDLRGIWILEDVQTPSVL